MPSKKYIPNKKRAIVSGKIATVYQGVRIVREYRSGERLIGELEQDNAHRYTGYVRRASHHGEKNGR